MPETEYRRRLDNHAQRLKRLSRSYRRLWLYLFACLFFCLIGARLAYTLVTSWRWVILSAIAIIPICRLLKTTQRDFSRTRRVVEFYQLGTARFTNQWQGKGADGQEFEPESHIYSADLNLFGKGSVFELLSTARTGVGRATLASWLLHPAERDQALSRQQAVTELRDRLDLREDWASLGTDALTDVGSTTLHDWVNAPAIRFPRYLRVLAIVLPVCALTLFLLWNLKVIPDWQAILAPMGLGAALAARLHQRVKSVTEALATPAFDMALLVPLLRRFEAEPFASPLLASLQSRLTDSPIRASRRVRTLWWLARLLRWRQIEGLGAIVSFFLWTTNFSMMIESWRQRHRRRFNDWLDSLGQFESLLCLARYYYENPDHTFPELDDSSRALFAAEGLGHPLIDSKDCVKHDVRLDADSVQLVMVSGSNMSGKSTLLRAVGVNAVLAWSGAPVRATRLTISRMQVCASIRIQDSLLDGKSRFQAEVERLKSILSLSHEQPTLFLLDEVLSGTNSNDRFFGAKAIIEELLAAGSTGLVTTHDLALTKVADGLGARALNVHFEEHYSGGEMRFDYKMKPGVVTRTNGLSVMAALGLVRADGTPLTETNLPGAAS